MSKGIPGGMDDYSNWRGNYMYGGVGSCVYGTRSRFHLDQSDDEVVKAEVGATDPRFHYCPNPNIIRDHHNYEGSTSENHDDIKSRIIAHPRYSDLLQAYMDCQKVLFFSYIHNDHDRISVLI